MIAGTSLAGARAWLTRVRPAWRMLPVALAVGAAAVLFAVTQARLDAWSAPVRLWEDAAGKAPGAWVPLVMLGDALDADGRAADAIERYRRAAAIAPDQPMIHVKVGALAMQAGDREAARRAFETAVRLDPLLTTAQNALGALALTEGRPAEARVHLEGALRADRSNVPARLLLAAVAEHEGQRAEARVWCEQAKAIAPETPDVDACLARNAQ